MKTRHCTSNEVLVHATYPVFYYQTLNSDAIWRNSNENETLSTNYKGRVWSKTIMYSLISMLFFQSRVLGSCQQHLLWILRVFTKPYFIQG